MKKGKARNNGLLPNSLRIISSCLKTVSTNASSVASTVRSAGVSVAASISAASEDHRDQVTWAGFDRLELSPSTFKCVLLLGYQNGFQVINVDNASNFSELVSKRDGPVTFLQMQPIPLQSDSQEGFSTSHPLLLVVAGDESNCLNPGQNHSHFRGLSRDGTSDSQSGNCVSSPTTVRFYSLRSNCYVHVLRFRSAVRMVRCSPRIVAVGLATQIYCFDALTLGNKFSVLTYPVPQLGGQGTFGVNVGYGPMAVGPRWLAYASNSPLLSNRGRLNPQSVTPSPGVSPSTSPGGSSLVARYAMESSKQLAAGIINLGDMGYKTLSKYCQDLIPDGSNSPGWKVGGLAAAEADYAGMVVIKDYVSRAVISQFRAHTSPISALCFDPSGTLLVTASVHGNNINIFRIMPSCACSGSDCQNYDWNSSHVHLYKLHRGMTTAIIQDISFSHYSQWISIVSSKGTCHVFVISPFGGDAGFQTTDSHEEPSLFPVLSLPWWFSSSCIIDQQSFPAPPPPHTLSVVSRIKNCHSGWLNTVSNAAASATGKVLVPSGAVAAVFHNSLSQSSQHIHTRVKSLEHLLVYTPSGHVIQHELIPSMGAENCDGGTRTLSGSFGHMQDEELRVRVEPIQWWDVCRRSEWPEKEECVSERQKYVKIIVDKSDCEDSYRTDIMDNKSESVKPLEKCHWYLSNAEVQISSGRVPIWHKSKISFYMMDPPRVNDHLGGEFEIEKFPVHEVEIRRKDLLPVFDHFHSIKSGWNDRSLTGGSYPSALSLESHQAKDRVTEETIICHSKPASLSSTESSDGGSSRRIENFLDLDQMSSERSFVRACQIPNEFYQERRENAINELIQKTSTTESLPFENSKKINACADKHITNIITSESNLPSVGQAADEGACSLNTRESSDVTMQSPDCYDLAMDIPKDVSALSNVLHPVDLAQFLQEGYHKTLECGGCHELAEVVTDDVNSSSSQCERENPDDDDEANDEMLGGIFAFSEEG